MLLLLTLLGAMDAFQLALYEGPVPRDGWVYSEATQRLLSDGRYEVTWMVEGDLKDNAFTERRRVEKTRWKEGEMFPPHIQIEDWARLASTPSHRREYSISCGTGWHSYEYDGGVEAWHRTGDDRWQISLHGRPFTSGRFHGLFGQYLIMTGAREGHIAEADIFDVRDGSHLRHVKLDLWRPFHFKE